MLVQLLEGIGAISRADGRKATARAGNYQDSVTRPLSRDHDDNATADVDPDVINAELDADTDPAMRVLPVVEKLRKIVRAVRLTPQRRQSWAREIQFVHLKGGDQSKTSGDSSASHMLILDVRTRWASTHQMLHT